MVTDWLVKKNKSTPAAKANQSEAWPHNDSLHSLDLDEVIEFLERTFIEKNPYPESAKKLLSVVREATQKMGIGHQPANRDQFKKLDVRPDEFPEQQTFSEKLGDLLPVVWADHRLWQAFKIKPTVGIIRNDAQAANLLRKFYNLRIPFQDSVWLELRDQPVKWNYLQFLMVSRSAGFFQLEAATAEDELTEIERDSLYDFLSGKLLRKSVRHPMDDLRPELSLKKYPAKVLLRISQAMSKLAKAAAWCARNPNCYVARRAPTAGHRIRNLRDAKAIEDMVVMLRQNVGISDNALAQKFMASRHSIARRKANQFKGNITAGDRKLAKAARLVAFYRENLPVKFRKKFKQ